MARWPSQVASALARASSTGGQRGSCTHDNGEDGGEELPLSDFTDQTAFVAAMASCPATWRYRTADIAEDSCAPDLSLQQVLDATWIAREGGEWVLTFDDELKSVFDHRLPGTGDPVLAALLAHPLVRRAHHLDTEVYCWGPARAMSRTRAAALALNALAAAHRRALTTTDWQ